MTAKPAGEYKPRSSKPTWKPEFAEQAKNLALLGAIDTQVADFFGVSLSTVTRWKRSHPEFVDALNMGKAGANAKVAKALYQRAIGFTQQEIDIRVIKGKIVQTPVTRRYPADTTACIFWLKNREPELWSNRNGDSASTIENQLKKYEVQMREIEIERAKFLLDELKAAKTDTETDDDQVEFMAKLAEKLPS